MSMHLRRYAPQKFFGGGAKSTRRASAHSLAWEALGLVVYEAYDHSRPVLVARSGGLPEIVIDLETGLVHDRSNAEQLAEQVIELESDARQCEETGRHGRSWLQANADESDWQRGFSAIAECVIKSSTPH
jgi:glycosyltransferase involved in cell wall biosynthesis